MQIKEIVKKMYLSVRELILLPLCMMRPQRLLDKTNVREILFLRHDRVGDMALSLSAIRLLKISFPKARLTVLASLSNKDLLLNNPYVDEVIIYKGLCKYIKFMRHKKFDLAIDPIHNTHELKPAFMTLISGAYYRIGFAMAGREVFFSMKSPLYNAGKSFMQLLMLILSELGVEDDSSNEPLIFIMPDEIIEAKKIILSISDKRICAVHPGAFYPSQRWQFNKFVEVAKHLSNQGFGVIFFAPMKEFPDFDYTIFSASEPNLVVIRDISMRQFISLLSMCEILICNNSGPLHIAGALKINTVSVMGPTVPTVWWPQGQRHIVIRRNYPCSPCNKAVCKTHSCMVDITVEEVLKAVYNSLNS